jgi:HTH-type transcriptional regulator, sugar sensing transcriptional regulator
MKNIVNTLHSIGLTESESAVYISLLTSGEATAKILARRTGITRTSVYDQIKKLSQKNLVSQYAIDGSTIFSINDPQHINVLLEEKIELLEKEKDLLHKELSEIETTPPSTQPRVKFFEGAEGLQQLFKDILWYDDIELSIFWSYDHALRLLGKDYLVWFNQKRLRNRITVKSIWPQNIHGKKDHIFSDQDEGVARKYLQEKNTPNMSYVIYDKKVIYLSSQEEAFGYIVESIEHNELMRLHFQNLWSHL